MKYIVQGTVTPLKTTVETPQYWLPQAPVRAPLPPARPFFSQARTIALIPVQGSTVAWVRPPSFLRPTKSLLKPQDFQVQSNYPITAVAETITPDKWRGPAAEVRRRPARPFFSNARTLTFTELFPLDWNVTPDVHIATRSLNRRDTHIASNYPVAQQQETVTSDKWAGSTGKPARDRKEVYYRNTRSIGFIEEFITDVSLDKWRGNDIIARLRKVVYFNQARTIGFVEDLPPEGPITLDKWIPSPGDVRRRVPKPRGTTSIVQFNVPAAETITSDKWLTATGRLIRPRPRPFFSNARTLTFTDVTNPGGVGGFDQYSPSFRVPAREKWINRYRSVQYAVEQSAEGPVTLDKWDGLSKLIRGLGKPTINRNVIIPFFGASTEIITADKWIGSRGQIQRHKQRPYFSNARTVAIIETPAAPSTIAWIRPQTFQARPSRASRFRDQLALVQFNIPAVELITMDKWFTPQSQIRRAKLFHFDKTAYPPDVITPTGWDNSVMFRFEKYVVVGDTIEPITTVTGETILADKWIGSRGQVIRRVRPSSQREWANYGKPTTFAETISLDKWLGSGSLMRGPRYPLFDRNIIIPFFGPGAAEILTLDKWIGSQGKIVRPSWRSLSKELAVLPQQTVFGEVITLDKWVGSQGKLILPAKRSESRELTSYGVPEAFIEIVTLDKWAGSQGKIIRPSWRSLSKELNNYPRIIVFNEITQLDKWIGSAGRMIDTRRIVWRDAVNQNLLVIEPITFDKWAGSQGKLIRPLRRSMSKELINLGKPTQFNEIISIDKWEAVWNHFVIRGPRPPLIVDLYGHTLIPRANAPTGRLEIYYVTAQDRVFQVTRRYGVDDDDRIYIVTPPQE